MNSKVRSSFYALLSLCFWLSVFNKEVSGQRIDQKSINPFKNEFEHFSYPTKSQTKPRPVDPNAIQNNYLGLYLGAHYSQFLIGFDNYMNSRSSAGPGSTAVNDQFTIQTPGLVIGLRIGKRFWFKVEGHIGFQKHDLEVKKVYSGYRNIGIIASAIRGTEGGFGVTFGKKNRPKKNALGLIFGFTALDYDLYYDIESGTSSHTETGGASGNEALFRAGIEYDRVLYRQLHLKLSLASSLAYYETPIFFDDIHGSLIWQF